MIFFIAYRYFRTSNTKQNYHKRKAFKTIFRHPLISTNLVNYLTKVCTYSLGVATAALIIILSVFNGLEEFTKGFYNVYNAQIKIEPKRGKFFKLTDSLSELLTNIPNLKAVTPVIEDNILIKYEAVEKVVYFKALADNYLLQYPLDNVVIRGRTALQRGQSYFALLGLALQYNLDLFDTLAPLQLWYPKSNFHPTRLNLANAFHKTHVYLGGTFAIDQAYNENHIFLPLDLVQNLLHLPNHATALDIACNTSQAIPQVKTALQKTLGAAFTVKTSDEQQVDLLRAIQSERLLVFVGFILILFIAAINIFFTLSVVTVEKKSDLKVLFYLGLPQKSAYYIFMILGSLIALRGTLMGLLVGYGLCLLQQTYGFVSIGVPNAVLEAYPIKMLASDFIAVALVILSIVLGVSYLPAKNVEKMYN